MKKYLSSSSFALILILFLLPLDCHANKPIFIIKESNDKILDLYSGETEITKDIREKAGDIIKSVTSFKALSEQSIAPFLDKLSDTQKKEFEKVFSRLLLLSSLKKLGRYRADRFEYLREEIRGENAIVLTHAFYGADYAVLKYVLKYIDSEFKIVNYIVDDIDTVQNYQMQFQRILSNESFDQLVKSLQDRVNEIESELIEEKVKILE